MIAAREFYGAAIDNPLSAVSREIRTDHSSNIDNIRRPVLDIILDIEQRDWYYNMQAGMYSFPFRASLLTIIKGALRQVLMNIFGNSQKYTESGYIMVQMRIREVAQSQSNAPPGDVLFLKIRDSGRGISKEYMERKLYLPFAQEDSFTAGVGLGLSIV